MNERALSLINRLKNLHEEKIDCICRAMEMVELDLLDLIQKLAKLRRSIEEDLA